MSSHGRREFLGGLATLALGGCKIEPILALPPSPIELPLSFPDLPPQIPDQLEDADATLRATTDALLEREFLLFNGELHERTFDDRKTVTHLLELLRDLGLEPAGNRGGWLLPVPLDIIEPTGAASTVTLRLETDVSTGESAEPGRIMQLAELGAFRQRGYALPHRGLLVTSLRSVSLPLAMDSYAGRVALIHAPKDLDLDQRESSARVDSLFSAVRDAGAIGCLLVTDAEPESIQRFRQAWQRQVRRPGSYEEAMLIEGVLGAEARLELERARAREGSWLLDVALATRQFPFETHDVIGRITGRERPDEAVVLTCTWDTPHATTHEADTLRLLASVAAFAQLAEWSRRSTPPRRSMILLLTVDAGFGAGHAAHAAWTSSAGTQTAALLALARPTSADIAPALELSGHYDAAAAELVRSVVASDDSDLLLAEQLALPSLAPYLRYAAPVLTIGAPNPGALDDRDHSTAEPSDAEPDPHAGIRADVRLLRNLMLAFASRR